jgi:hypothetical protein
MVRVQDSSYREGFVAGPAAGSAAAVAGDCGATTAGTASAAEARRAVLVLTVCKSLSREDPSRKMDILKLGVSLYHRDQSPVPHYN